MSETDEKPYRAMVTKQSDQQVDAWAADLFIDFAKRRGVGTAIAAFCAAAKLNARAFQRAFLVGGGPDHVVGIDTNGELAAPIFELAEGRRRAAEDRPQGARAPRRLPRRPARGDELHPVAGDRAQTSSAGGVARMIAIAFSIFRRVMVRYFARLSRFTLGIWSMTSR